MSAGKSLCLCCFFFPENWGPKIEHKLFRVDSACAHCPGFLVLAAPAPASTSVSEPQIVPLASILLHEPLDICLDLLPAAPLPPVQKRDAQHMFLQHRGAHTELSLLNFSGFWRDIQPKIPGDPAKKFCFAAFRRTCRTFWPPLLRVEDPHPARRYPDQKVWVWVRTRKFGFGFLVLPDK